MSLSVSTSKLMSICDQLMDGHVSYMLKGKVSPLDTDPSKVTKIDCSGFVQYVLYNASNKTAFLKSGSWYQNQWCIEQRLEKVAYSTANLSDGWLRLGYFPASKTNSNGHIWLILDGKTLESHGGKGPNSRPWDTAKLKNSVTACYKVAQVFTQNRNINWRNVC